MHIHSQALQQIDGRYTDTQETEIQKNSGCTMFTLMSPVALVATVAPALTQRKKMEPSDASELVELVNYNDLWMKCVNG